LKVAVSVVATFGITKLVQLADMLERVPVHPWKAIVPLLGEAVRVIACAAR